LLTRLGRRRKKEEGISGGTTSGWLCGISEDKNFYSENTENP